MVLNLDLEHEVLSKGISGACSTIEIQLGKASTEISGVGIDGMIERLSINCVRSINLKNCFLETLLVVAHR